MFYSTSSTINDLFSSHLRIPILRSAELDDNRDGITERIELGIQLPLFPAEKVTKFTALVYHDVELKDKARCLFDAVSYISYESGLSLGSVHIDGDIIIRQTWPLEVKGG
jgi:hypothetical protein